MQAVAFLRKSEGDEGRGGKGRGSGRGQGGKLAVGTAVQRKYGMGSCANTLTLFVPLKTSERRCMCIADDSKDADGSTVGSSALRVVLQF